MTTLKCMKQSHDLGRLNNKVRDLNNFIIFANNKKKVLIVTNGKDMPDWRGMKGLLNLVGHFIKLSPMGEQVFKAVLKVLPV